MDFLFRAADRYLEESDWKTVAILKFCLCAMGILVGCKVPEKKRKPVILGAGVVFIATYIPLMHKLFRIMGKLADEETEE